MNSRPDIDLVLASTSAYRRELLQRLGLPFRQQSPHSDETARPDEPAGALASRLAAAKAAAVAARNPAALVIGSDQVAACPDGVLGKPGSVETARKQLRASSSRNVLFYTAVCLIDGRSQREFHALDTTTAVFRTLRDDEIERYLARETPFDCAGSFKSEGLGISLFDRIETQDPTALIGLPLIALCRLLREAGIAVP
ncbi:MAG: septum formation inhibitor Maf [Proteobacteria bacterium]|nr:septum formation inhibitor Maf [Pseudomonadota bacterium]